MRPITPDLKPPCSCSMDASTLVCLGMIGPVTISSLPSVPESLANHKSLANYKRDLILFDKHASTLRPSLSSLTYVHAKASIQARSSHEFTLRLSQLH